MLERNNSADCIKASDIIVFVDALPITCPPNLVSPLTFNFDPSNVNFASTVPLGEVPFNVIIPLSVVPVRESKPDVPEVPEVPFTPLVPFTTPTEVIT